MTRRAVPTRLVVAVALALAVGLASAVSPFASAAPDGLQRVAADEGFAGRERPAAAAPASGYAFPGIADERLATATAGFAGTLAVLGLGWGLTVVLRRRAGP